MIGNNKKRSGNAGPSRYWDGGGRCQIENEIRYFEMNIWRSAMPSLISLFIIVLFFSQCKSNSWHRTIYIPVAYDFSPSAFPMSSKSLIFQISHLGFQYDETRSFSCISTYNVEQERLIDSNLFKSCATCNAL
jgi:hypothetical protein